jgi:mannose-6-phosphate isomerase-like protein (cupin superfamily)
MMEPVKVNLDELFGRFEDLWSPKIVQSVNDYHVKITKVHGEFVWHAHHDTDEFFLVTKGRLRMRLEGRADVVLGPGDMFTVPRGLPHCPVAEVETQVLLLEPRGTVNTGNADTRNGDTGNAWAGNGVRAGTAGEYLG